MQRERIPLGEDTHARLDPPFWVSMWNVDPITFSLQSQGLTQPFVLFQFFFASGNLCLGRSSDFHSIR